MNLIPLGWNDRIFNGSIWKSLKIMNPDDGQVCHSLWFMLNSSWNRHWRGSLRWSHENKKSLFTEWWATFWTAVKSLGYQYQMRHFHIIHSCVHGDNHMIWQYFIGLLRHTNRTRPLSLGIWSHSGNICILEFTTALTGTSMILSFLFHVLEFDTIYLMELRFLFLIND